MADVAGTTSSTVDLAIGSFQDSDIESANEDDFFRVTLTALRTYTFRAIGAGTDSFTLVDPVIEGLYRASNTYVTNSVTFNNDGLISGRNGRDSMVTYTVPSGQDGQYWVSVSGDLRTLGTYRVTLTDSTGNGDNSNNTRATAATIAVGGSDAIGSIDSEFDAAWYKVSLVANTTYTIRLRGLTSGGGTLADPVITGVYDRNGTYLTHTYIDDFDTRDATLTFIAPASDDFYIAAEGWSTYTGTFSLDVDIATADIPGNTTSVTTLTIGQSTTARMEQPYDHDWYAVNLTAGTTYQFSMAGTGGNNTPGIHGVFNSSGTYVGGYAAPVLGPGTATAASIFTPTVNGTYYIDAFSLYQGTYTLSAAQLANDIPNTRFTSASVTVNGAAVSGDIGGATDIDWYSVSLTAGNNYAIRIRGRQSNGGTLDDPLIAGIYDANGVLVRGTFSDDSDGNEPSLVFNPPGTGTATYFIAADGYASYTGTYSLSVNLLGADVGQALSDAQDVALNTPTVVTIDDAADADWYKVYLTAGSTYGIRLQGAATKRGTIYDPLLAGVYDSTGTLLDGTFVDDARNLLNSYLSFQAPTSGYYYISAEGYDRFTGTMKLAVTIDDDAVTRTLSVGTPAEGTIDTGIDVDRYNVTLNASTTYYIRMLGLDLKNGDLADPNITIRDPNNATSSTLFTTSTITDPTTTPSPAVGNDAWVKVVTTATGGGVYKVDAAGANGTDGAFLLTIDTDVPNTTATTQTLTVGGAALSGMIDEATDADWFRVTLPSTTTSYVIKMLGVHTGNGTLADPRINGLYLSTNTTTPVANTNTTGVDNAVGRDSVVRIVPGAANSIYYINAASSGSNVGSFMISAATEVGQSNTISQALAIGQSTVGTIDDTPDADWYKVTLTANTAYVFKLSGVDGGGGTLDFPQIANIRSSGGTLQNTFARNLVGTDVVIRWIPGTGGDYYLDVQGGGTDVGTFTLSAALEIGNTLTTADNITVGGSATGTIDDYADTDYFRFTHSGTANYIFRMRGLDSGLGTLADPLISAILNTSLAAQPGGLARSEGRDAVFLWSPTTTATTDFLIDARSESNTAGTFQLSITTEAIGHTATTSDTIVIGGSKTGTIDIRGDSDWFKFSHGATNTGYLIRMRGVDSGGGTLSDPEILAVRNASGTALTTGFAPVSDGTADSIVRWSPDATGATDYYIDASGNGSGTFLLSIETEAGHTAAGAMNLPLASSLSGTINDSTDADWYQVSGLTVGRSYVFKMLGSTSNSGTLTTPSIPEIRTNTGGTQTGEVFGTGVGNDAVVRFVATQTSAYIDAQSVGNATGTYVVSAALEGGGTNTSAMPISLGVTYDAAIDDSADFDRYSISLSASTRYRVSMTGGTLADSRVAFRNSTTELSFNEGTGRDAVHIFTTPASTTTYYIEADNGAANTSIVGTYTLKLELWP